MTDHDAPAISMPAAPAWPDIRDAVGRLCDDFPNSYWLKLDKEDAYPHDFVRALTESGFLGALIPEEFGGSGLPLAAAGAVLEPVMRRCIRWAPC